MDVAFIIMDMERRPMARITRAFIALMFTSLVLLSSMGQGALPTHSASDVMVEGPNLMFKVTVVLMAKDNGTYHVEISDVEDVTERFELQNNGSSEKKALASGVTYNFTMDLRSLDPSAGETTKVPYEIYMNEVLVSQAIVNITVKNPKPDLPQDFECNGCGLIIPLCIVASLFIVTKGTRRIDKG